MLTLNIKIIEFFIFYVEFIEKISYLLNLPLTWLNSISKHLTINIVKNNVKMYVHTHIVSTVLTHPNEINSILLKKELDAKILVDMNEFFTPIKESLYEKYS